MDGNRSFESTPLLAHGARNLFEEYGAVMSATCPETLNNNDQVHQNESNLLIIG
jgi:hypothetical protein